VSSSKRILLFGGSGQVGGALLRNFPAGYEVLSPSRTELDLYDLGLTSRYLDECRPAIIINAAAYTDVEAAETDRQAAFALNAELPRLLASWSSRHNTLLIHYSSDYVFDGHKGAPYIESDSVHPVNVYGMTKSAGEEAIRSEAGKFLIFRTSWVYSDRDPNFVLSMLGAAESSNILRVVGDQTGCPTWAQDIATRTLDALSRIQTQANALYGLFHLTGGSATTWHLFATEIFRIRQMLLGKGPPEIDEVLSSEFPRKARRPANSSLNSDKANDCFNFVNSDWRERLFRMLSNYWKTPPDVAAS
jgi:dTDP-4-dehydrorhamnose reductase